MLHRSALPSCASATSYPPPPPQDAAQRDKLVSELKRELKRLQRLRESVRSWLTSNDVFNPAPLEGARRAVEVCMETFRGLERELKTKPFGHAGLARDDSDPRIGAPPTTHV